MNVRLGKATDGDGAPASPADTHADDAGTAAAGAGTDVEAVSCGDTAAGVDAGQPARRRQAQQRRGAVTAQARSAGRAGRRPPASRRRRRSRRSTRGQVIRRRWVALLVLLGVLGLTMVVLFTPLLGVSSVEVAGVRVLTVDQVRAAADVAQGSPMVRLSTAEIAARVAALPRVATVSVSRSWPDTVRIDVTERTPMGVLVAPDGVHLVDDTGYEFATIATAPSGLPRIALPSASPSDARTQAVVRVLAALPIQLRPLVTEIDARTPASVWFTLVDGRTALWGSTEDSARKSAVLAALLTRPGRIFDVSSPDLPTVS